MTKTDIINLLIAKNGYQPYLEIGVAKGKNFKQVEWLNLISVDYFKHLLKSGRL